MTCHFPFPEPSHVQAIIVESARCWRDARDRGDAVQPRLARTLDPHGQMMLTPVLDSLCHFYEASLGRPMEVGAALSLSADEERLLGLIAGGGAASCVASSSLDCALCSARIMMGLAGGRPQ